MAITTDSTTRGMLYHHLRHADDLHAEVVHARDAEPDDTPPVARGTGPPVRLNPTMDRPIATTATATIMLTTVSGTLYRSVWPRNGEAEHRDEVHRPDAGGPEGDRGEQQPQRALGARVRGPAAHRRPIRGRAGRQVAEYRVQEPVREVMGMHDRHAFSRGDRFRER